MYMYNRIKFELSDVSLGNLNLNGCKEYRLSWPVPR